MANVRVVRFEFEFEFESLEIIIMALRAPPPALLDVAPPRISIGEQGSGRVAHLA